MTDKMLDIQIVRALNAVGPLTRKQIISRVNDDQVDVEASLDALVAIGCLRAEMSTCFKGDFEYRLAPHFGESDCKRALHRQRISLYVSRHGSNSKAVLPVVKDGISFGEGLDRAIWKATNTGRWMMVREIRDILTKVGFRGDDVVARIQRYINEGTWFERQRGHKRSQFFMLRSGVECPELPGMKPLRGEMRVVTAIDVAAFQPSAIAPTMVIASNQEQAPTTAVISAPAPAIANGGYFSIAALDEDALKVVHQTAELLVKPDYTLHEAIWAVMDGEEYSYADLTILLEPFGFTGKQISPLLSKRFSDGLLSRRLIQVDGKWVNVYKKERELPAKYTSAGSVVSAILEAQQPSEVEVIAADQSEKMEESAEKPELFSNVIQIKGVTISPDEFKTLYWELRSEGFRSDPNLPNNGKKPISDAKLLRVSYLIKGVEFSAEELNEVVESMVRLSYNFKL